MNNVTSITSRRPSPDLSFTALEDVPLSDEQVIAFCASVGITWRSAPPTGSDCIGPAECFTGPIDMAKMKALLTAALTPVPRAQSPATVFHLRALARTAEEHCQRETDPAITPLHMGMRDAYSHAASIVSAIVHN